MHCPFCHLPPERIIAQNEHAFAIRDAFPVSPGHTLIIPRRHIGSFFSTTPAEKLALLELLDAARNISPCEVGGVARSGEGVQPDAYNIGINDGPAAGQTVPHLHIHLIPRYKNDVPDPRGGVRWVMPEKADYWSAKG